MITLAILLAMLGALLSAVGVQLQSAGVRAEARANDGLRLRGLARLVRNPRWLLGLAVLAVCAALQVLALALAPVTVVAPIVVLALPMSALLNARSTGGRLDTAASIAVLASAAGVGLFVVLAAGAANPVAYSPANVLRAGELVAAVVALLGVIGAMRRDIPRCLAFAAGAGAAYGLVSVLVRDVTYTFQHGGITAVSPLSVVGMVVAFLAGGWLLQLAYASGPPDLVVGCQTVLNPLVATGLGIGMFNETVDAGGWRGIGLVAGGVVAILGVTVLARHRPDARGEGKHGVHLFPGHDPGGESGTSSSASTVR
jgi:hypothetical protein